MADRLNATVTLSATNPDGAPFASFSASWNDLPYEDFVRIEAILMRGMAELQQWAEDDAKRKK